MTGAEGVAAASWPASGLADALAALVERARLGVRSAVPAGPDEGAAVEAWLADAQARLGLEIVGVTAPGGELDEVLRRLGPALLRLPEGRWLAVLRGGAQVTAVAPGGVVRLRRAAVEDALLRDRLAPELAAARALVRELGLPALDERALRAFAAERLGEAGLTGCWLVRPSPAAALAVHARAIHAPLLLAVLLLARAAATAAMLLMWWLIGRDALAGAVDGAAVSRWAMCLLTVVPLRLIGVWAQGRLGLDAGGRFKEALLFGVLQLDRAAMRSRGVGQFMGMAMEGEVSAAATETALVVLLSLVELAAAGVVLALGAGLVHALLLVGWVAWTARLCRSYVAQALRWATLYRQVTHDLIERMAGYQTRLVQEREEGRHDEEDALLHAYLVCSQELDRRGLRIDGIARPGWLVLGVGALLPTLVTGEAAPAAVAVTLGGVLMAGQSLRQLVQGVVHMVDVVVSWDQTAPILAAGRRALDAEAPAAAPTPDPDAPLLAFRGLTSRHVEDGREVLRGVGGTIRAGDRILLEGPSGGGKSTLAALLAGLRDPDAGELRLLGAPRETVPVARWRGRVVLVPQFHDNHVLTESLLFNLLMGRGWPPSAEDVRDAEEVCARLGLGPVLERMPQGLAQTVGDGGWVLSHGERSRVFLARALLQRDVALVVLDESFAALDPETLRLSCRGLLESAPTLLVIAHP